MDLPEYHQEGMGCGLEDRGINCIYEACEYGFHEALDRCYLENIKPLEEEIKALKDKLAQKEA